MSHQNEELVWKKAVERGRTRGYECMRPKPNAPEKQEFIQYAMRKKDGSYQAYFFAVDPQDVHIVEDCAEEELLTFDDFDKALQYLCSRGADPARFAPFKGQKPF